jgi:hypothetical protein
VNKLALTNVLSPWARIYAVRLLATERANQERMEMEFLRQIRMNFVLEFDEIHLTVGV